MNNDLAGALTVLIMFGVPLLAALVLIGVIVAGKIEHAPDEQRLERIRRMDDNAAAMRELERYDRDMRKKHGREWSD